MFFTQAIAVARLVLHPAFFTARLRLVLLIVALSDSE